MPYINDRIEENLELTKKSVYEKSTSRVSRFKYDPQTVMASLRQRIVGQNKTLHIIEEQLITIKADFCEKNRPLCVVLLMGPTGTGKTETVRLLCEELLGSSNKLSRIDMNTLGQEHYSAALTGSPPGYVGSKEGTSLFDKELIEGSFSEPGIVLFDEIEKADKSVSRAIMNIFDTGKLMLTAGTKEIDFSNSLIFMTSNIVARNSNNIKNLFPSLLKRIRTPANQRQNMSIENTLFDYFDPEFINRIDRICIFNKINKRQLSDIVDIEIEKLNLRLFKQGVHIHINSEIKNFIDKNYNSLFGVRDLKRIIKQKIEPKVAQAMLNLPAEKYFLVTTEGGTIIVKPTLTKT